MLSRLFIRLRSAPVTTLLFAACVALFVVAERTGTTTDSATLLRFGAVWRGLVWEGEWWRLFTSMFLHVGVLHLVWNVVVGFSPAMQVEQALGSVRYLALYVVSGVTGSALSVIGHDVVAAGASGALFGIIGAEFVFARTRLGSWRGLWSEPRERRRLVSTGVWFLVGSQAGFDNYAHLGGLVAGLLLTSSILSRSGPRLAAASTLLVLIVLLSLRPLPGLHRLATAQRDAYSAAVRADWAQVLELTRDEESTADPTLLWYRASALEQLGRHEELTALLPLMDDSLGERSRFVAYTQFARNDFAGARQTLEAALRRGSPTVMVQLALARVLMEQGELDVATLTLQRLLASDAGEQTGSTWQMLGNILWRQGKTDEALAALETGDRIDGAVSARRVQTLIALARLDEARALLPAVEATDPERLVTECGLALRSGATARPSSCDGASDEALWFVTPQLER